MNGKFTYRMSSVGECPRALSAMRLQYSAEPVPAWVERAAQEGNLHEDWIATELRTEGYEVHDQQLEVILEFPSFRLVGHIDGKVSVKGQEKLLEIKTMSQFEHDRWMRTGFAGFTRYQDQLTAYMEATGLDEALYIVKNRNSGYEDRAVIKGQPSSFEDVLQKLSGIEMHIKAESLVEAEYDETSLECRRCAYKALCIPEPKDLSPVEELILFNATVAWRTGKKLEKEGQELINGARTILEHHTKATDINKRWNFNKLVINLVHINEHTRPETIVKEHDQLRITDLEKQDE